MKKILCALALLFSPYVLAQSIPDPFIGTWGTGESCENPAGIEKQYISANENMAPMFVDKVVKINDGQIKVFAVKYSQGTKSQNHWTLTREKGYLILEDAESKQRFLQRCNPPNQTAENNTDTDTPASRWVILGEKPNLTLMLDTSSKRHGSIWIKTIFKKSELFSGKVISHAFANKEYDCKQRTGGTVQIALYPKNGQPIQGTTPLNKYKAVQPESTEEELMKIACDM